jgi:hypothetical protein
MGFKKPFTRQITRRDFLKKSAQAGFAVGGGLTLDAIVSGCASPGPKEKSVAAPSTQPETIVYPPLKGHKIQPPDNGCLVGFRRVFVNNPGQDLEDKISYYANFYEKQLGQKPYALIFKEGVSLARDLNPQWFTPLTNKNIKPFIVAKTIIDYPDKPPVQLKLKDIVNKKHDDNIENFATKAAQFGEKYGSFFVQTMEEMNANWNYFGQQPELFKKAWIHIWRKFEEKGVNKYATWVWEIFCPEAAGSNVDTPNRYYPGDEYVDWIGLSAFARKMYPSTDKPFSALVGTTYNQMRRSHPQKPIMQAEFGKTNMADQPRWLKDAYKTIKSMPGMKAVFFWDNVTIESGDDHTLSEQSLRTLKEILKDPYWIMTK